MNIRLQALVLFPSTKENNANKRSISTAKEHGVDISKKKRNTLKRNFLINLIKYFVWIPKTIKMFCL